MKRKHIIATLIIAMLGIIIAAVVLLGLKPGDQSTTNVSAIPSEDPMDITSSFFSDWLEVESGTTTAITLESLLSSPRLSAELKEKLTITQTNSPDPVLCQSELPERMGAKLLFNQEYSAQVMMLARGLETKSPFQAIVTLVAVDGQWQLTDIACSQGDVAPIKDFDFEREGFLLKSVPPPLNPNFWHLVYEENGQRGRTVPLTVTPDSLCVQPNGEEQPCNEADFRDATKVFLRADMSESGATIRRLEF